MEVIKAYPRYINYAASLFAGIFFVFVAITVFGYGAALVIPKSILDPLTSLSPSFAFSLVDIVTLGIPAAIIFMFFGWAITRLQIKVMYTLMASPFILFMLFSLTQVLLSTDELLFYLATWLAKVLPVVICALFLAKRDKADQGA